MTKLALVIGIDYKGTSSRLNGCINDASKIREMLINNMGFEDKNIIFMTDDSNNSLKPTHRNIIKKIKDLVKKVKKDDQVYFHYSGHGVSVKDVSGDESDGEDEALIPLDFRRSGFIIDDTLKSIFCDKLPLGSKVFMSIDCCHSGTGFDLKYILNKKTRSLPVDKIVQGKFIKMVKTKIHTERGVIEENYSDTLAVITMISGCKDNQVSLEVPDGRINGKSVNSGVMTHSLIKIMEKYNYNPTREELYFGIVKYIKSKKLSTQDPQMSFGRTPDISIKIL